MRARWSRASISVSAHTETEYRLPACPYSNPNVFEVEHSMAERPYPSFWMYKDNKGEWRWTYHGANREEIAVSSESYKRRVDCERGIEIMQGSKSSPTWMPTSVANDK